MDLKDMLIKVEDEDQGLLLLSSILPSYSNFVDIMTYGRHNLSLEEVQSVLNYKELKWKAEDNIAESLNIRG